MSPPRQDPPEKGSLSGVIPFDTRLQTMGTHYMFFLQISRHRDHLASQA